MIPCLIKLVNFDLKISNKNLLYLFLMNNLTNLKDFLFPEGKRPDGFMLHDDLSEVFDWITSTEIQINRDSDELTESNWQVFIDGLEKTNSEDWRILRFGHFACGYYEIVILKPNSESYDFYIQCLESLENYPVLDEEHFCNLEHERIMESIKDNADYDLRSLMVNDDLLEQFESEFSEDQLIEIVENCYSDGILEAIEGYVYLEDKFEDIKNYIIENYFDSESVGSVHDGSDMLAIFADWYGKDLLNVDPAIINDLQNKIDIYNNSNYLQESIETGETKLILNNQVHHLFIDESGIQAILFNG